MMSSGEAATVWTLVVVVQSATLLTGARFVPRSAPTQTSKRRSVVTTAPLAMSEFAGMPERTSRFAVIVSVQPDGSTQVGSTGLKVMVASGALSVAVNA